MHINSLIDRFLRETGLPPTKFGRLVAGDPRLVLDIRSGREIRPKMEKRLRKFIAAQSGHTSSTESEAA